MMEKTDESHVTVKPRGELAQHERSPCPAESTEWTIYFPAPGAPAQEPNKAKGEEE